MKTLAILMRRQFASVVEPVVTIFPVMPDCDTCAHFKARDPQKADDYDKCLRWYHVNREMKHTLFEDANYAYRNLCRGLFYREKKN